MKIEDFYNLYTAEALSGIESEKGIILDPFLMIGKGPELVE